MLGIDKPGRGAADVGVGVGAAWGQEGQRGERKFVHGGLFLGKFPNKKNVCGQHKFSGGPGPPRNPPTNQRSTLGGGGGVARMGGGGSKFFFRGGIFSEEGIKKILRGGLGGQK